MVLMAMMVPLVVTALTAMMVLMELLAHRVQLVLLEPTVLKALLD